MLEPLSREMKIMTPRLTKTLLCGLSALGMVAMSAPAAAAWIQGAVQEIRVIANGNADDKIVVFISTPTGCTYNGFMLLLNDPYFKESYSLMLSAKALGAQIKYDHSYCHSSGFARGNQYSIVN
jgi:hypothetical protein